MFVFYTLLIHLSSSQGSQDEPCCFASASGTSSLRGFWSSQHTGGHLASNAMSSVRNERTVRLFQELFVKFVRSSFTTFCTLGIVGAEQIRDI